MKTTLGSMREQLAAHVAQQRVGVAARARDDRGVRARPLAARNLQERRRRLAQRHDLVIRGDADDLERRPFAAAGAEDLADRALRPARYRRASVSLTIATRGVSGRSASVNAAPFDDADAHRLEVLGRDRRDLDGVAVFAGRDDGREPRSPSCSRSTASARASRAPPTRRRESRTPSRSPCRRTTAVAPAIQLQRRRVGRDDREAVDRETRRWCAAPR